MPEVTTTPATSLDWSNLTSVKLPGGVAFSKGGSTGISAAAHPIGPLNLGNRVPVTIYPRNFQGSTYTSTPAELAGGSIDGGTSIHRQRTHATFGLSDLVVLYQNYHSGESVSTSIVTVSAVLEYPQNTFTQLLFNGATSVVVNPRQTVLSDPLGIIIPANTYYWIRTYATVPAPGQISTGLPTGVVTGPDLLGVDLTNCGDDYPADQGTVGVTNNLFTSGRSWLKITLDYSYGPSNVIGTPLGGGQTYRAVVGLIGDSIITSTNDLYDGGYAARALIAKSTPFYRMSFGGDYAVNFAQASYRLNRMPQIAQCSTMLYAYGTNDIATNSGATAATVIANILQGCLACGCYGAPVWVSTITPRTTSTDGWVTAANQTVITGNTVGYNVVRLAINAYIRAAASAGAGNSLAFDLAAQGTLFGGYIDIAQGVETNAAGTAPAANGTTLIANADRYVGGYTVDGIHPTQAVHTALAAIVPVGSFV